MTKHFNLAVLLATLSVELFASLGSPGLAYTPSSPRSPESLPAAAIAQRLGFTVRGVRPSRNRLAGIARGSCLENGVPVNAELVPLVTPSSPDVVERGGIEVELTTSAHPSFFVYVPPTLAKEVFVDLQTDDGEILYEAMLTLPDDANTDGKILEIAVPQTVEPLTIDGIYSWSVSLLCNPADANPFIEGWVQRIQDPALASQIDAADERNYPNLYATAGIWHDTIASLAALRRQNPTDVALVSDWVSLLDSVDLADVAEAPIVQLNPPANAEPAAIEAGLIPRS